MEDFSEIFNGLSNLEKRNQFATIYNLMVKHHRMCGWIIFFEDHFLFFDSKPSFEDAIWVNTEELWNWIVDLEM